jgi:group I intron endonuclease
MKEYVGQTKCWKRRWSMHCQSSRAKITPCAIHKAMKAYGIENFAITVVRRCYIEELNYWEEYYVEKFDTLMPAGYNMTLGGDNVRGVLRSKVTITKHKLAINKFYTDNPGARGEMSLLVKAAFAANPVIMRRLAKEKRGKPTGRKGMKFSLEWRAKLSEAQYRRYQRPEEVAKRKETAKAAYDKDPTLRARTGAASSSYWQNLPAEERVRIGAERSARTKALWAEGRLSRP